MLRVVLANPLTNEDILEMVLDEQCTIVLQQDIQALLEQIETLCADIDALPRSACA